MGQFIPKFDFFYFKTIWILIIISLITKSLSAQKVGSVSGAIIEKSTLQTIKGATITLANTDLSTTSDSTGYFRLLNIPVKTYNLVVNASGFKSVTIYNVVITTGNEKVYAIELDQDAMKLEAAIVKINKRSVRATNLETPLSIQKLTGEEIQSNPGGSFDISKVIQTLPGVGGGVGGGTFRNDIIIRGGASNENVFYLDGIEVPVINHFQTQGGSGGPQGILNTFFIQDVTLNSSAFDAKYDNALSSVFAFTQKTGNPNKFQGNIRASIIESALTLEGPLSKNKKTTFLISARKSYFDLLSAAVNAPYIPKFVDFQTKISHKIDNKTTLNFIGIGAIDNFKFITRKGLTPEQIFSLNSAASIQQWNYTMGLSLRRSLSNGFWNLALSRTHFNNNLQKFEDNDNPSKENQTLNFVSNEIENKLRFNISQFLNGWKLAYGASVQYVEFNNNTDAVINKELRDSQNNIIRPEFRVNFSSPLNPFAKMGAYVQLGRRVMNGKMGVSGGIRSDMNTFTTNGMNGLRTLSPRASLSYSLAKKWTLNASSGIYYKLPVYSILGFADKNNALVNQNSKYTRSIHYTSGVEFIPNDGLRVTVEGFYKLYSNVAVSIQNGISLANLGTDFTALGNEAISTSGEGKSYGIEFFIQKKLTKRIFGIVSYTYYRSLYSGIDKKLISSSWDNRHLLSMTFGYKFKRNWELGLKFRYQGGAPYTPWDQTASRLNYAAQSIGIPDYTKLNSRRLGAFNSSDIRIDKKINFKKVTLNVFLDVTNWYMAKNQTVDQYTWARNADNTGFKTTDGMPIKADGSNAIETTLIDDSVNFIPTLGLILLF